MSQIGFIGLGNMGNPMARNLLKSGHELHVFDISKKACNDLESKGAAVHPGVTEVTQKSNYVITMLPNNNIVEATYKEILFQGLKKDTTFIDCSTISPKLVKSLLKRISSQGGRFLDAPVSGGVPGAQEASLTFMVGGAEEDFKAVTGILECMGQRIVHCGAQGMGQAAKLCNNMMLAISMIGTSEAMNLAVSQGLDAKIFAGILNSSTGRCWASEFYNPVPGISASTLVNKVPISLINKDLDLALDAAKASNSHIPMGELTHKIYSSLIAQNLGHRDFSDIYQLMQQNKFTF
ncbi:probable 3-hydroxyisobutyrate dehydrogenase, mitochondrial [Drosophila serrata]|uniref:probable 3-hydroxyisobutyrate dehydrogenase, mitochondrial n=1 Tax=Drosophila serrata TaxID=7274 RepID=UPI000A1D38EA|nr:probable 3-hydroxyisobutyrate dehydrogenase, mitochondrial [Drosophila serrata]